MNLYGARECETPSTFLQRGLLLRRKRKIESEPTDPCPKGAGGSGGEAAGPGLHERPWAGGQRSGPRGEGAGRGPVPSVPMCPR